MNESDVLGFGLAALVGWAVLSYLYQSAWKPSLSDGVRFELFALRDRLRRMAFDGEIDASGFSYTYLETALCRTIHSTQWATVGTVLEVFYAEGRSSMESSPELCRFEREATPAERAIHKEMVRAFFRGVVTNSPLWAVAVAIAGMSLLSVIVPLKFMARLAANDRLDLYEPQRA